ncbi:hypothetical protein 7S3_64 [uncultured Caudovirales phage]|uniref:Uncharacterized protein n=1 Tax=uncultured Caudovirales phage TaxID=2100421 RepID=A0A2H4J2D6_9CAUD|nr:hypothetical protein 7S3_64 [uncultured Caudovirales phage]
MLSDGTRRITVIEDGTVDLAAIVKVAHGRWSRLAEARGLRVRYIRCVETCWNERGLIGGVFEAELEKA